jgi:hypothetical protein
MHLRLRPAFPALRGEVRHRLDQHATPSLKTGEMIGVALLEAVIGPGLDKPPSPLWQMAGELAIQLVQPRPGECVNAEELQCGTEQIVQPLASRHGW